MGGQTGSTGNRRGGQGLIGQIQRFRLGQRPGQAVHIGSRPGQLRRLPLGIPGARRRGRGQAIGAARPGEPFARQVHRFAGLAGGLLVSGGRFQRRGWICALGKAIGAQPGIHIGGDGQQERKLQPLRPEGAVRVLWPPQALHHLPADIPRGGLVEQGDGVIRLADLQRRLGQPEHAGDAIRPALVKAQGNLAAGLSVHPGAGSQIAQVQHAGQGQVASLLQACANQLAGLVQVILFQRPARPPKVAAPGGGRLAGQHTAGERLVMGAD